MYQSETGLSWSFVVVFFSSGSQLALRYTERKKLPHLRRLCVITKSSKTFAFLEAKFRLSRRNVKRD